jgi:hypothetical protein
MPNPSMKQMKKQLAGLMAEVFDACETPDGKKVKPPSLETPRSLKGLRKGRRLTFAEVNELASRKAPVCVEYENRDGERCEDFYFAERRKDGGWDFDDGFGLIVVEKDGYYGPWIRAKREEVGQKYKPDAMFEARYTFGVYEAVKRKAR